MIDPIIPPRISAPASIGARSIDAAAKAAATLRAAWSGLAEVDSAGVRATGALPSARSITAEGAPIDNARVERIRAGIADGSLSIDPQRVAAAMIAAEHGS